MYWLGLDFETTGLDTKKDSIIEVGAVLWDVKRKSPAMQFGALIKGNFAVTPEITRITGITKEDTDKFGVPFREAIHEMGKMIPHASHIVAHNGTNFDRPILNSELLRHEMPVPPHPWIDTAVDVDYPPEVTVRKLTYLATEHGFLNPFAHRAVSDVLTMMKIASYYDPEQILKWAASPPVTIRAKVSYDDRLLASARGYRWDAERKFWIKSIKEFQLEAEKQGASFEIVRLS
jgi:DNA polymerase III subunit epsilon